MESYKHSCPVCGQHVEYTAGYCGRQMQCPICGNTITFPAIPPKTGGKTIYVEEVKKPIVQWAWNAKAIFVYLRDYPHWKIVGQVLVPFILIGALLAGASFVKKRFSDESGPVAPVIQAPQGGWDKMTELARADQKMQECVQSLLRAHQSMLVAQAQERAAEGESSRAHGSQEHELANDHERRAQFAINEAQKQISFLRAKFETEFDNYQKLGGTVDYRSKVPF